MDHFNFVAEKNDTKQRYGEIYLNLKGPLVKHVGKWKLIWIILLESRV